MGRPSRRTQQSDPTANYIKSTKLFLLPPPSNFSRAGALTVRHRFELGFRPALQIKQTSVHPNSIHENENRRLTVRHPTLAPHPHHRSRSSVVDVIQPVPDRRDGDAVCLVRRLPFLGSILQGRERRPEDAARAAAAEDHTARMQAEETVQMQAEQDEQDTIRLGSKQAAWMASGQ